MTTKKDKKVVPLRQGLFKLTDASGEHVDLLGSKCSQCGKYFHPKRYLCLNCGGQNLTEVMLSKRGKVRTYTVVHKGFPFLLVSPPFVIAVVDLPEEVGVRTILDCKPEQVQIGMDVEIAGKSVGKDEEDNEQIAFVFKPT